MAVKSNLILAANIPEKTFPGRLIAKVHPKIRITNLKLRISSIFLITLGTKIAKRKVRIKTQKPRNKKILKVVFTTLFIVSSSRCPIALETNL